MNQNKITVGDITIVGITDGSITFDPRILFPKNSLEIWSQFYDRFPEYFSGKYFKNNLGSFVFTSKDKIIIADTGFGPNGLMLGSEPPGKLLNELKLNNINLSDITNVFITHLHGDHFGWNFREDLPNRPITFTNAEYMIHKLDWDHYTNKENVDEDILKKIVPLESMNKLYLLDEEKEIAPGITAFHTPGHTPGHMSLLIASQNERAILVVDIFGSPMHITETDLFYTPDWDQNMAKSTRKNIINLIEKDNSTIIGSHLSFPGWGKIIRWKGKRYWKAL